MPAKYPLPYIYYLVNLTNPPNDPDIIEMAKKLCVTLKDDTEWEKFGMSLLGTTSNNDITMIGLKCQGKSPVIKYQKLLEEWKEHTSESQFRWEKVRDVLNKMNFKRLAEAMVISGGRDNQSNGTGMIQLVYLS